MSESSRLAFVTGGTGFVGSHLVEELLARGYSVRALVRNDPKWLAGLDVETVAGDLHDTEALAAGVDGADLVVHLAGLTRARDQATLDRANVDGTRALLDAVRAGGGAPRVLVTSSLEAMGPNALAPDGAAIPATEADRPQPISMYGVSKARMEDRIRRDYADLGVTVVRPPAVYGSREADLFEMAKGAARGLFPIVGPDAVPRLSLVHVSDLVRGMADLAEHDGAAGETYFLGTPGVSWAEVRAALEKALGRKTLALRVPRRVIGAVGALAEWGGGLVGTLPPLTRDKAEAARHAWICDSAKAAETVGYAPAMGLAEGWAEAVGWYRQQGWL
ncbi:NAD-dependent epimerase/dehydratase family protein [Rubrivirga sp. IMCC45206]|uniref:NAD-dependent epimerase/dehydratase family protein n=1 Tax=Rubrivirga sp. IMCC45206 TaxID=3391614 RepID=UPI00398FC442